MDAIARSLDSCDPCADCSVIMLNYRAATPTPTNSSTSTSTSSEADQPLSSSPPMVHQALPSYLQAYLGSRQCQRNLLLHICVSNESQSEEEATGCSYKVGQVTVVRPGSLRYGNFCILTLTRKGQGCGWEVGDIAMRRYPTHLAPP